MPVSYTHLDVYKRQGQAAALQGETAHADRSDHDHRTGGSKLFAGGFCLAGFRLLAEAGDHAEQDVYKRQALNSCVLGTVLVERTQSCTLMQSLGFGLGSGVGYLLAVLLVTEAQHRLRSKAIPSAFRGLDVYKRQILAAGCSYAPPAGSSPSSSSSSGPTSCCRPA